MGDAADLVNGGDELVDEEDKHPIGRSLRLRQSTSRVVQRTFNFERESFGRDEALRLLRDHRADVIEIAFDVARTIAHRMGVVTSTEVLLFLRSHHELRDLLEGKDPRFMGAVFRRKGWERIGWSTTGSHCRPVAMWKWVE